MFYKYSHSVTEVAIYQIDEDTLEYDVDLAISWLNSLSNEKAASITHVELYLPESMPMGVVWGRKSVGWMDQIAAVPAYEAIPRAAIEVTTRPAAVIVETDAAVAEEQRLWVKTAQLAVKEVDLRLVDGQEFVGSVEARLNRLQQLADKRRKLRM